MRTLTNHEDHEPTQWPALQTIIVATRDYKDDERVFIELHPGEKWEQNHNGPTEEGYKSRHEEIHYSVGGWVYRDINCYERDCDGPHESHYEARIFWDCLDNMGVVCHGFEWKIINEGQRDHYAESMGY